MIVHHHHHHYAPFAIAGLLIIVTILTGVATFTDHWGVASVGVGSIGIYHWGQSGANRYFQISPGWLQCVVVCQLMAFSFELLFCLLVIPAIIFRRMMPVHAACTLLSLIIFILLLISIIVFGASIGSYSALIVKMQVGWSWGISLAATILAFVLFLVSGTATGYGAYSEYR